MSVTDMDGPFAGGDGVSDSHVCVLDKYGTCDDPNRDYCGTCERCTPWQGEVCDGCNGVWGVTA